jgi:hypothetical protein
VGSFAAFIEGVDADELFNLVIAEDAHGGLIFKKGAKIFVPV